MESSGIFRISSLSSVIIFYLLPASILSYGIGLAYYRLYISPLAKFPGPKLAALTLWYEFYYDVILSGQYTWRIGRMHEKYGPIVRISPYELHISDPDYYDVLFAGPGSGQKRDKYAWSAKMFGNSTSMFGTVPHDHHRLRRSALNPFFSRRSVLQLEPYIKDLVEKMCRRLEGMKKNDDVVNVQHMFAALTMDVITEYAFSDSTRCLEAPDFAPIWNDIIDAVGSQTAINKQFDWLLPLTRAMPIWLVKLANPDLMLMIGWQKHLRKQIREVKEGLEKDGKQVTEHPTIFHDLLTSDLPPSEKSMERLADEAQTVLGAGQVTTAYYLRVTTYHILANPAVYAKLHSELSTAMPDPQQLLPLPELEKLPYLSAVVQEGFRTSYGVTGRLQRIAPDHDLRFRGWTIPRGTPVGMTSIFAHDNPVVFPEPHRFIPERWLGEKAAAERKDRYLVNFSKGTRACLGQNLATAEIFLAVAAMFRRFRGLKLFDTEFERDVAVTRDFLNPMPSKESRGVRITVT